MALPGWLRGSAASYGRPVAMRGPGGMVTIRSRTGSRRVSVRPAFDPMATSMTPVPGWTTDAAAPLAMAA